MEVQYKREYKREIQMELEFIDKAPTLEEFHAAVRPYLPECAE